MSVEGFTYDACALAYHLMCAGRLGDDLYSDYECTSYSLPHDLSISQTLAFIQLDSLGDFYYGSSGEFHFTPVRTYASFWCMILHGIVDFGRDQRQREKKAALRLIGGDHVPTRQQWEGILATALFVWTESCSLWEAGVKSPALAPPLSVLYCAVATAQREYHLDIVGSTPAHDWVRPSTPTKRYSSDPTTLLENLRSGRHPHIPFDDTAFRSKAAARSEGDFAGVADMAARFGSVDATREGCLAFDDLILRTLNNTCRSSVAKSASDYGTVCYYSLYEWFRGWVNLAYRGPPLNMA